MVQKLAAREHPHRGEGDCKSLQAGERETVEPPHANNREFQKGNRQAGGASFFTGAGGGTKDPRKAHK